MIKKLSKKKAIVDKSFCVGCGKCAQKCPASAIEIKKYVE